MRLESQSRRKFIKKSLSALGAALAAPEAAVLAGARGANEAIRVGVAGLNGRGGSHVESYLGMSGVRITYLIDPDTRTYRAQLAAIEKKGGGKPAAVQDIRRALDDKDLDAISIATPNHWHSLMTIWACQAGKDVYVEKPCSHNVSEGRAAVDAARKHGRMVQHGTQSRSGWQGEIIAELARRGTYGKLLVSRGLCYKRRDTIGFKQPAKPPAEVDFNLWLGPAAEEPFHENLVHYNWHWFWKYGCGDIGNQGVHEMDIARWAIRGAGLPRSAISLGGRFGYTDQGQTPNTQIALFDYGDTKLMFEVRGLPTDKFHDQMVGNTFHFEEGVVAGAKFYKKGTGPGEPLPKIEVQRGPGGEHFANFIACVKSRKASELNADILEGHLSSALCHLANVSYRLGATVPFDAHGKGFGDDRDLLEAIERMGAHLEKNGVKTASLPCRLGRKLTVNAETESIAGDAEANSLLTRDYRSPFTVPPRWV